MRNGGESLQLLTPKYDKEKHGYYCRLLSEAVEDPGALNIALTGDYGVGKSSILQGFLLDKERKDRAVEISLSTLMAEGSFSVGATRAAGTGATEDASTEQDRERLIQREIVKQLLYSRKPQELPASRFRRIREVTWQRSLGAFFIVFVIAFVVLHVADISVADVPTAAGRQLTVWAFRMILAILAGVAFGMLHRSFAEQFSLRQLSAGAASVTLGDQDELTYFDKYLDEVVYFFEKTKCEFVIFEDIDRFGDTGIFESLRALNRLLNAAQQVEQPVRFIYAVRSSIFASKTASAAGGRKELDARGATPALAVACDRTKFFDVIVPVVPFISHHTARNHLTRLLEGLFEQRSDDEKRRFKQLTDLAAPHLHDMRLLRNIRNEYLVFRSQLGLEATPQVEERLKLDTVKLLAMVIYKNVYIDDFRCVTSRTSSLDQLYSEFQRIVQARKREVAAERQRLSRAISRNDNASPRAKRLADSLELLRSELLEEFPEDYQLKLTLGGEDVGREQLEKSQFWSNLIGSEAILTMSVYTSPGSSEEVRQMPLRIPLLKRILGEPFDIASWRKKDLEDLRGHDSVLAGTDQALRYIDFQTAIRVAIKSETDSKSLPFDRRARDVLPGGLAFQLVEHGFIDMDYALYASKFHSSRLTTRAANFVYQQVLTNKPAFDAPLDEADLEVLLDDLEPEDFGREGALNVTLFHWLHDSDASDPEKRRFLAAGHMRERLARGGHEQRNFVHFHLCLYEAEKKDVGNESVERRAQLVKYLAGSADFILVAIVHATQDENDGGLGTLSMEVGLRLFDLALRHLGEVVSYKVDESVRNFLSGCYERLDVLTCDDVNTVSVDQARRIARVFESAGIKVQDLATLAHSVRDAFADAKLYELTYENLKLAAGGASLALDTMQQAGAAAYEYAWSEFPRFLDILREHRIPSVQSKEQFVDILRKVHAQHPEQIEQFIVQASLECVVDTLDETIPSETWLALVRNHRIVTTNVNIVRCAVELFEGNYELARDMLMRGRRRTIRKVFRHERMDAAYFVMNTDRPVSLHRRLELLEFLRVRRLDDVTRIESQDGELWEELLLNGLLEDCAETLAAAVELRVSPIDRVLEGSEFVGDNPLPGSLTTEQLVEILDSSIIDADLKDRVIRDLGAQKLDVAIDDMLVSATREFFERTEAKPHVELLETLAIAGADAYQLLRMLMMAKSDFSFEDILRVLDGMKEPYSSLIDNSIMGSARLPNDPEHRALIDLLENAGFIVDVKFTDSEIIIPGQGRFV